MTDSRRAVLPSLGLPEDSCGRSRGSQLTPSERELYRWILRSFGAGRTPSLDDIANAEIGGDMDAPAVLDRMVELDLIQRSDDGAVDCAYPFSARPTGHDVVLEDGTSLHAMCAIDALGIPLMLHRAGVIHTSDPASARAIQVGLDALGEVVQADPPQTVVLCAVADGPGPLSTLCCPQVNTFESARAADGFLRSHRELTGLVLSLTDAVACAQVAFGGVLS
jgi:alkylmercury lyase